MVTHSQRLTTKARGWRRKPEIGDTHPEIVSSRLASPRPASPRLVWPGLVWFGLVWSRLVSSGLVWSHLVWSRLVWSGLVSSRLVSSRLVSSRLVSSCLVSSRLVSSRLVIISLGCRMSGDRRMPAASHRSRKYTSRRTICSPHHEAQRAHPLARHAPRPPRVWFRGNRNRCMVSCNNSVVTEIQRSEAAVCRGFAVVFSTLAMFPRDPVLKSCAAPPVSSRGRLGEIQTTHIEKRAQKASTHETSKEAGNSQAG